MKRSPAIFLAVVLVASASVLVYLTGDEVATRAFLSSSPQRSTASVSKDINDTLPTGVLAGKQVNMIVEIPRGSQNKYEFDKELGIVKLDRVLFSAVHFPGEYGMIPGTLAGDGDPLDAIVLVTEPTYPGVLIEIRPIGVLTMEDGGQDDKILAVPVHDVRYEQITDLTNLSRATREEISEFFRTYKNLEGKRVKVMGWKSAEQAWEVIADAVAAYEASR